MLVVWAGVIALFRSFMAAVTIVSNGAQDAGLAFAATGQPRSLGKITWNRCAGSVRVCPVVLLNPNSVPLTLTLYQVACTSRPRRKVVCGATSKPTL